MGETARCRETLAPQINVARSGNKMRDTPVRQKRVVDEVAQTISQKGITARIVEQTVVDVGMPRAVVEITEVVQTILQEDIMKRIVERIVFCPSAPDLVGLWEGG